MKSGSKKPTKRRTPRFSHRTHPAKLFPPPAGYCHWCHNEITLSASKKFCGRVCEDAYVVHVDPKAWRKEVWRRDRGICRECGTKHPIDGKNWQADHILPLFIAGLDWNFWSPENGCVLCTKPCHEEKTASDKIRFGLDKPRRRPRR